VRAVLYGFGLDFSEIKKLWAEAAATATDIDATLVQEGETKSAFQKFFGKGKKSIVNTTKKFGEPCISTSREKIKAKLSARGITMHWIGYAHNHAAGTYRLYNPGTGRIIMSRDVVFLEPKETRKPEKELAVIQEKSSRPTRKKNEARYVSDEEEDNKNVHESDTEEENGDITYLIPPEEQYASSNDETETNEEEQDCSCAFRIPT
jgi:hypothetical protein